MGDVRRNVALGPGMAIMGHFSYYERIPQTTGVRGRTIRLVRRTLARHFVADTADSRSALSESVRFPAGSPRRTESSRRASVHASGSPTSLRLHGKGARRLGVTAAPRAYFEIQLCVASFSLRLTGTARTRLGEPAISRESTIPMLKGAAIVLIALATFAPLGLWLQRHYDNSRADLNETSKIFAVPQQCRPEPGERLIYLSGMLFIPAAIFLFARFSARFPLPTRLRSDWIETIGLCLLTGGLVWFSTFATSGDKDDAGNGHYHVRFNFLREHPAALAFVPLFVAFGIRTASKDNNLIPSSLTDAKSLKAPWSLSARWFWPLLITVSIVPWAGSVFSDQWYYASKWHFNAVFDSVVRVNLPKTLPDDATSPNGQYAWFLGPHVRCIGLSVAKFTAVMGLLTAGSFLMVGLFLWRQVNRPFLAIAGLIATLFNGWVLFLTVEGPHRGAYLDLYFQYVPLRLLVPASALGLIGCWLQKPTRVLSRTIWGLVACGILWNLDSGAPAFVGWVLMLLYIESEPGRPKGRILRCASQFAEGCVAVAGIFAIHALCSRWSGGAWPNYSLLFRSQFIFYAHGFAMLPGMPWPGTWMLVIAVYLAGLTYAGVAHANGTGNPRARAVFLVSVLGLMLFSYYQGRSHRAVLILAWWPVFPLLTLLLDALLDQIGEISWRRLPLGLVACLPAAILVGSVASFFENLNMVGDYAGRQLSSVIYPGPISFDGDAAIVRSIPLAGEPMWIISSRESILHLASRRSELTPCSFNELLLMADYPAVAKKLEASPDVCIWLDRIELESELSRHQGVQFVAELLARSYEPIAVGERGWLFRRRKPNRVDQNATIVVKEHFREAR